MLLVQKYMDIKMYLLQSRNLSQTLRQIGAFSSTLNHHFINKFMSKNMAKFNLKNYNHEMKSKMLFFMIF